MQQGSNSAMDKFLTGFKAAAMLAAGMVVAGGCSRAQQPAGAAAEAAADAPAALPAEISIPGTRVFPESITSTADGSLYIGSVGQSQIYRVAPGATTAEVFVAPGTGGAKQIFGVLADEASGTLWACSNELSAGPPGAAPPGPSALHGFDLATGAAKSSYALPSGAMCNDIAVAPSGDTYATDTSGMRVLRLPKGGTALEVWSPAGAFGEPGGVLDGIAVVGGRVIANTLVTNKLFAVEVVADGKAGAVKELALSAPLTGPDGMRAYGSDGLLSTDGTGKIQHVTINGDAATVTTVKDGLEGPVSVTAVGKTGYALEGQLAILFAPPGGTAPAEKPYRAVVFTLP
jgi:sugar lactone lactonase YvrE